MGDIVGKYKGIKVYEVTVPEYINGRLYKDEENMYLIGEDLIYKNEVFATYNGTYVNELDLHQRYEFYRVEVKTDDIVTITPDGNKHFEEKFVHSVGNSKNETKTSEAGAVATVEETLAGVYEIDYFSSMTDIDAFLKSNS